MGIDHSGFSPRVQQKIVHAGVNGASYQQASRDLAELSDLDVKPKPVERLVKNYPFAEVNNAIADSLSGATIKPVLTFN